MTLLKLILGVFLYLISTDAYSQSATLSNPNRQLEKKMQDLLWEAVRFGKGNEYLQFDNRYEDRAFLFGFRIFVSNSGLVDSIVYTNRNAAIDSIVSFERITAAIKKNQVLFKDLKDAVIVSFALVRRSWDKNISNPIDFTDNLKSSFPKSIPQGKKLVLIAPFDLSTIKSYPN